MWSGKRQENSPNKLRSWPPAIFSYKVSYILYTILNFQEREARVGGGSGLVVVADVWDDLRPERRYAFLQRAPAQVGLLGRDALWQDGQLVHQPGMKRWNERAYEIDGALRKI